ncbi:putative reverse transcriptase domain-containing protein [Tanacetum coccineum]
METTTPTTPTTPTTLAASTRINAQRQQGCLQPAKVLMLASYLTAESVDDTTKLGKKGKDIKSKDLVDSTSSRKTKEVPEATEDRVITKHQTSTQGVNVGCKAMAEYTAYVLRIGLLPIELGSFDVIVGMDWMAENRTEVVCYEKYIRVPYGNDMLIIQGEMSGVKNESRLEVISSIRTQKYIDQGFKDFPEVFPEDLPGLPPTRQVEFHIELIPGAAHVARAPYRLAPAEMKELAEQLKELSDKDPAKIEAVKNWASPTTPSEIRQFLGLAEQEEAFQLLKQKLCVTPILALPEGSDDFVVYYDASIKGLGVVLMQGMKVIAYASKQLERTTPLSDLGIRSKTPKSDLRLAKFIIIPRKENVVADALSRKERIEPLRVRALVMTIGLDLSSRILEAQREAVKIENIKAEDISGMLKKLEARADGTLCLDMDVGLPCLC